MLNEHEEKKKEIHFLTRRSVVRGLFFFFLADDGRERVSKGLSPGCSLLSSALISVDLSHFLFLSLPRHP